MAIALSSSIQAQHPPSETHRTLGYRCDLSANAHSARLSLHMIHFNMDVNEFTWLNEGCSDLAVLKCYGYTGTLQGHVNQFELNPDNDLTEWEQQVYDYGNSFAFIEYLDEHYGGSPFTTALVAEPGDNRQGVTDTLAARGFSDTFTDVFLNWTVTVNFPS